METLVLREQVNLSKLREELPNWTWEAYRDGFSWRYRGTKGDRTVCVYRVAYVVGPADDDFASQWMTDDKVVHRSYVSFMLAER